MVPFAGEGQASGGRRPSYALYRKTCENSALGHVKTRIRSTSWISIPVGIQRSPTSASILAERAQLMARTETSPSTSSKTLRAPFTSAGSQPSAS